MSFKSPHMGINAVTQGHVFPSPGAAHLRQVLWAPGPAHGDRTQRDARRRVGRAVSGVSASGSGQWRERLRKTFFAPFMFSQEAEQGQYGEVRGVRPGLSVAKASRTLRPAPGARSTPDCPSAEGRGQRVGQRCAPGRRSHAPPPPRAAACRWCLEKNHPQNDWTARAP